LLSGKIVGYSLWRYILDCAPFLSISSVLCVAAYYLSLPVESNLLKLTICIAFVGGFYILLCTLLKLEPMLEMWGWVHKMINQRKKR